MSGPQTKIRPRISAIVTTFNEEEHVAACLESVAWCDEILVVDSYSTDRTVELAEGFEKVRLFQHEYHGGAAQKNWALQRARHEWILIFDADERCTPELRDEIQRLLEADPDFLHWTTAKFLPTTNFTLKIDLQTPVGFEVKPGRRGVRSTITTTTTIITKKGFATSLP